MDIKDIYTNAYLDKQDDLGKQHDEVLNSMKYIFKEEITPTTVKEDIESDLRFEIGCVIDQYGYSIDPEEVMDSFYKCFDIKGVS